MAVLCSLGSPMNTPWDLSLLPFTVTLSLVHSYFNSLLSASSPLASCSYHRTSEWEPTTVNLNISPDPIQRNAGKTWSVCKNKVHNHLKGLCPVRLLPSQPHQAPPPPRFSRGGWGWLIRGLLRERNGSLANGCNDRVREEGGVRL